MVRKILSPLGLIVLSPLWIAFGPIWIENSAMEANAADALLEFRWEPSPEGTHPEYYIVQLSVDGGDFVDVDSVNNPVTWVEVEYGKEYSLRVAGVDASGVQGPFSDESPPHLMPFPSPSFSGP